MFFSCIGALFIYMPVLSSSLQYIRNKFQAFIAQISSFSNVDAIIIQILLTFLQYLREKFRKLTTCIFSIYTKANMEPISTIIFTFIKQVALKFIINIILAYSRHITAIGFSQIVHSIIMRHRIKAT